MSEKEKIIKTLKSEIKDLEEYTKQLNNRISGFQTKIKEYANAIKDKQTFLDELEGKSNYYDKVKQQETFKRIAEIVFGIDHLINLEEERKTNEKTTNNPNR